MLRSLEVHTCTIHFNVNVQFAWHLWRLMMHALHVGAKIMHVYVQLYLLVSGSYSTLSDTYNESFIMNYKL